MPTFLVLRNGVVSETIKGANAAALKSAILSASKAAGQAPAKQSAGFSSKGQVLGSASTSTNATTQRSAAATSMLPSGFSTQNLGGDVTRFVALYLTTLFSFDAAAAASASPYARATA